MKAERIFIIDDEIDLLDGMKRLIGMEMPSLVVETWVDPLRAIDAIRGQQPDLVLLDVRMPVLDGMAVLSAIQEVDPHLTCIMITAYGTIELAVAAIKAGAYDFITKPFDTDALLRTVAKGLERNRLIRENRNFKRLYGSGFHGMIGRSPVIRRLFEQIRSVARSDYNVLIRGESGTGKELSARALHAESRRKSKPMITVNCPAIAEALLESELFGHRRGAFTGAEKDRRGLFEEADGGTLFLDEIADIPVAVQTKLLRALEEGEIKPVGATRSRNVNVRIVAATNQDLEEKIRQRTFREDLYYRLNVVTLHTPNLKEAAEDIPLLAGHFAQTASNELNIPPRRFSVGAFEILTAMPWAGNIRELQNTVRRAVMFSNQETITEADLRSILTAAGASVPVCVRLPDSQTVEPYRDAKERALEAFTRAYVEDLLKKTNGNVTRSADLSGLGRASLQKIMRRMGIQSERFRS